MSPKNLWNSIAVLEESKNENPEYLVAFSGKSQSYCIGMVDIINSTNISANMHEREWCKYYVIFLNSMTKILKRFGGIPLKNGGDSILYYFPESSQGNKFGFSSCLECSLGMAEVHEFLSEEIKKQGLPKMDYRISADYGKVVIMEPNLLSPIDVIGPPVNMCAKINRSAPKNGVIIGGDLYEMVKDLNPYSYKEREGYSIGLKYSYPAYTVSRRQEKFRF